MITSCVLSSIFNLCTKSSGRLESYTSGLHQCELCDKVMSVLDTRVGHSLVILTEGAGPAALSSALG